jgi:hypothetical protein
MEASQIVGRRRNPPEVPGEIETPDTEIVRRPDGLHVIGHHLDYLTDDQSKVLASTEPYAARVDNPGGVEV